MGVSSNCHNGGVGFGGSEGLNTQVLTSCLSTLKIA